MIIRVLLADDHAIMRDGIKALLASSADIEVVAEATNGRDALRAAEQVNPDVVVMDISMPDLNGIEATRMICDRCPQSRVLMLTMQSSSEHMYRSFQAGAKGYMDKASSGSEICVAIRAVHAGQTFVSQHLESSHGQIRAGGQSPIERLSARERHVLQLVVEGHSSAEIAARIHLSPKTVETYRSRLGKKLGVEGVTELVKFAVRHGLTA